MMHDVFYNSANFKTGGGTLATKKDELVHHTHFILLKPKLLKTKCGTFLVYKHEIQPSGIALRLSKWNKKMQIFRA